MPPQCLIPDPKDAGGAVFISESRAGIVNAGIYDADENAFAHIRKSWCL